MQSLNQTRNHLEVRLVDRALRDAAFRAELLANPTAMFQRRLGSDVPDDILFEVLEELPSPFYFTAHGVSSTPGYRRQSSWLPAAAETIRWTWAA